MRLIDADVLKVDYLFPTTTTGTKCYQYVSMEQIQNAPTIEERKTAKDICNTANGHCEFKCSACGVEIGVVEGGELDGGYFKFCPNCGADMRGDK